MQAQDITQTTQPSRETARSGIEVWTIRLDVPDPQPDIAASSLAPDELERAARYRNDTARRHYILSHAALRQILATHLNQPAPEIKFHTGPNGKPALAAPNPARLEFNLTHSGALALVAISRNAEVGIDVEILRPMRDAVAIARRFFTHSEAAALEALDPSEQSAAFLNLWTRKEAFVKATGHGIVNMLARHEVSWDEQAVLRSIDGDADQAAHWSLHSFTPAAGYLAAVAVHAPHMQISLREFHWR